MEGNVTQTPTAITLAFGAIALLTIMEFVANMRNPVQATLVEVVYLENTKFSTLKLNHTRFTAILIANQI